jgi:hypothetical protein
VSDSLLSAHPDIATIEKSSKPITKKLIFFIIFTSILFTSFSGNWIQAHRNHFLISSP